MGLNQISERRAQHQSCDQGINCQKEHPNAIRINFAEKAVVRESYSEKGGKSMKEAILKIQRTDVLEDQLIGLEKSKGKATKANPDHRVVNIPISKTQEYKRSGWKRRMNMWFMFRELRNEFDEIERNTISRQFGIQCCEVCSWS